MVPGCLTAVLVLPALPELGPLHRRQAAALAGLCPDSSSNHLLKPFYDRLIAAGKPFKVTLTAIMRKLILLMDHLLKKTTSSSLTGHRGCRVQESGSAARSSAPSAGGETL
jgi:hypothetical protein